MIGEEQNGRLPEVDTAGGDGDQVTRAAGAHDEEKCSTAEGTVGWRGVVAQAEQLSSRAERTL